MNPLNPYLTYKRDTSRLIFWVVRVSNTIIRTASNLPADAPRQVNTTGEVSVSSLVALSKLIATRVKPVPRSILALFDSVITARTDSFEAFQKIQDADPGIERSNASHKHFIDALVEAFEALGGAEYVAERDARAAQEERDREARLEEYSDYYDEEYELEEALFANKFAALGIEDSDDESGSEPENHHQDHAPKRRQQRRPGAKSKKGKGNKTVGKKRKGTGRLQQPPKATTMDEISPDNYRILQGEDGHINDYHIAVYSLFQEMATLRCYAQGQWRDTALYGLNTAVAAALGHIAVNFVQRTTAAIFLDFPGLDSYATVLKAITRGDIAKVESLFYVVVHDVYETQGQRHMSKEPVKKQTINIREHFMVHTYEALVDFITDFRKTRTGKPTKPMLQELNGWDPNFNLRKATPAERVKWRRGFIINWLYDLVNIFTSVVIERNRETDNRYPLEEVDWSKDGPWDIYRRVYGVNEFAGFVTTLAVQKPGSEIQSRIMPYHVFQLQCIADSLAMSKGWIATGLFGHSFRDMPKNYDPQRDIKRFLDREEQRMGKGWLHPVDLLRNVMIKDGMLHNDPSRHSVNYDLLRTVKRDFTNSLGRVHCFREPGIVPPSRFANYDIDGFWNFCPYLCGAGLEEALRESFHRCLTVFDKLPEPILMLHLHNMLVKTGHLKHPITLWATLQELLSEALFVDGKAPNKKFLQALRARIREWRVGRAKTKANEDFWTLRKNIFFKRSSLLLLLNAAGWNPDRIPDKEISMPSSLALHRVSLRKPVTDPVTGRKYMEDTEIVKRARKVFSEEQIVESVLEVPRKRKENRAKANHGERSIIPDGYSQSTLTRAGGREAQIGVTTLEMLELIKLDICNDVNGTIPLSALNWVWVMTRCMALFLQFEEVLKKARHPIYIKAYETEGTWSTRKRIGLILLVLESMDEDCMRMMAHEFETPRAEFLQHIFWEELELDDPETHFNERGGKDPFDICTIM